MLYEWRYKEECDRNIFVYNSLKCTSCFSVVFFCLSLFMHTNTLKMWLPVDKYMSKNIKRKSADACLLVWEKALEYIENKFSRYKYVKR